MSQVRKLQNQYLHSNAGDGTLPQAFPGGTRPKVGGDHDIFQWSFCYSWFRLQSMFHDVWIGFSNFKLLGALPGRRIRKTCTVCVVCSSRVLERTAPARACHMQVEWLFELNEALRLEPGVPVRHLASCALGSWRFRGLFRLLLACLGLSASFPVTMIIWILDIRSRHLLAVSPGLYSRLRTFSQQGARITICDFFPPARIFHAA